MLDPKHLRCFFTLKGADRQFGQMTKAALEHSFANDGRVHFCIDFVDLCPSAIDKGPRLGLPDNCGPTIPTAKYDAHPFALARPMPIAASMSE